MNIYIDMNIFKEIRNEFSIHRFTFLINSNQLYQNKNFIELPQCFLKARKRMACIEK